MNELLIDFSKEPQQIRNDILGLLFKEQEYWVALWIAQPNVLNDMRYRPVPSKPSKLAKDDEIKACQIQRSSIKAQNWRNLKELRWAKSILQEEELKQRIDMVINGFIDIDDLPETNQPPDKNWQD